MFDVSIIRRQLNKFKNRNNKTMSVIVTPKKSVVVGRAATSPYYTFNNSSEYFCYAFLQADNSMVFNQFLTCREFGCTIAMHGIRGLNLDDPRYNYNFSQKPMDTEKCRILFFYGGPPDEFQKRLDGMENFSAQIGNELGIGKTEIFLADNTACDGRMAVAVGDKEWLHSPPLFSLFLLSLRLGLSHTVGNNWRDISKLIAPCNDTKWIDNCIPTINKMAKIGYKNIFNPNREDNWIKSNSATGIWNYGARVGISGLTDALTTKSYDYVIKNHPSHHVA